MASLSAFCMKFGIGPAAPSGAVLFDFDQGLRFWSCRSDLAQQCTDGDISRSLCRTEAEHGRW